MKEFKFNIGGQDYTAQVVEEKAGSLTVTVNGQTYNVEVPQTHHEAPRPGIHHAAGAATAQAGGPKTIVSELPGTVTEIKVKDGDRVKKGDVLLVIEAMKMANDIVSDVDGTVQKITVAQGQNVSQGDALVELTADFVAATAPAQAPKPAPAAPAPAPAPKPAAGNNAITAPLPGTITKILVKEGQTVTAADTVCMLEAMKMENEISAGASGTIKSICVKEGAQVQQGDVIVELA